MKIHHSFLALACAALITLSTQAQTQAVTSTGETVTLFENGTWEYTNKNSKDREVLVNSNKFTKHPDAVFQVKSKRTGYAVYIDPSTWKFEKENDDNENDAEYSFNLKNGSAYALMITEKAELSFELLKKASLVNANKVAPDARIVEEEYRMVNGHKVLMLQLKGTIEGLAFTYYGYYVTGETGTVQLITFTTSKMFPEQKKEMEKFLNGLTMHSTTSTTPVSKM